MNELDEMYRAGEELCDPALVRETSRRLDFGDRVELEVGEKFEGFGSARKYLVVRSWNGVKEREPDETSWDDEINSGLLDLGVRSVDRPNEAKRFSLVLRTALNKFACLYGDGYLNSVLTTYLRESDICRSGKVSEMLKLIEVVPVENTEKYKKAQDLLSDLVLGRAVELRDKLGYGKSDVESIMTEALAIYLDERFSITFRRKMGYIQ